MVADLKRALYAQREQPGEVALGFGHHPRGESRVSRVAPRRDPGAGGIVAAGRTEWPVASDTPDRVRRVLVRGREGKRPLPEGARRGDIYVPRASLPGLISVSKEQHNVEHPGTISRIA